MRSLIFVGVGILLWALALLLARWQQLPYKQVAVMFIGIWFAVALINMWLGVATAGYSVLEEFPIFLLIFLPPSALVVLTYRQFFSKTGQ